MSVPEYVNRPVEVTSSQLTECNLAGKSVLITGGASGLGRAYTDAFAAAGAFVTICDVDSITGNNAAQEHADNAQFIPCDVRNWEDQVRAFDAAVSGSPMQSIDIFIGNAGVVGAEDIYKLEDPADPPSKPNLRIVEINLIGTLYTSKLAMHYFRRQPLDASRDRCLIIKASIAAYADQPGSPQYNVAKYGARGLMRNLRRTAWKESIRVNVVAPWYVRTPILDPEIIAWLESAGVQFALVEDCVKAMRVIACDSTINGRAIGVVSRTITAEGIMDLGLDDFQEGSQYNEWQDIIVKTALRLIE